MVRKSEAGRERGLFFSFFIWIEDASHEVMAMKGRQGSLYFNLSKLAILANIARGRKRFRRARVVSVLS